MTLLSELIMTEPLDDYNHARTESDEEMEIDEAVQSVVLQLDNNSAVNNNRSVRSISSQSTWSLAELDQRRHNNYFYDVKQKLRSPKKRLTTIRFVVLHKSIMSMKNVSAIG
jgi:hypothetical protein